MKTQAQKAAIRFSSRNNTEGISEQIIRADIEKERKLKLWPISKYDGVDCGDVAIFVAPEPITPHLMDHGVIERSEEKFFDKKDSDIWKEEIRDGKYYKENN